MKTPIQELIDRIIKISDCHLGPNGEGLMTLDNMDLVALELEFLEKEKHFIGSVIEWYENLEPSDKVSVWSKGGDSKGLFNLEPEQLADKFIRQHSK